MAIEIRKALQQDGAYQLTAIEKTAAQFCIVTPRWLLKFLQFKAIDGGVYRVNKVKDCETLHDVVDLSKGLDQIPEGFIQYMPEPREYVLDSISSLINVDTRVQDIFSNIFDHTKEQIRHSIDDLRECQESEIINNADYGLLNNVADWQKISPRKNAPTPDDLDELITRVWKEPSFFLAHPRAIAAFERECTRRGVPPVTANIHGGNFVMWRGIPIVPSDKLYIDGARDPDSATGKTNILLIRTGENNRGVVGLHQSGLDNEGGPGLTVRSTGIDRAGVESYLINLYSSAAVLSDDAIAVLENVEIGEYYDY